MIPTAYILSLDFSFFIMTCTIFFFFISGFVKFKSHMQTIQDFMPVDFMGTTDILHDCFTDSQVSDVFNCESSIAANQLILKYLTANLSDVKDLLEFCTQLEKISKSLKMNTIISDIRSSCESYYNCIKKNVFM